MFNEATLKNSKSGESTTKSKGLAFGLVLFDKISILTYLLFIH